MVLTSSLSRRRFLGTAGAGLAAAVYAGAPLPAGLGKVVLAQAGGKEMHTAWPYEDPGAGGHFNQFVTHGIMNPPNLYGDLMYVPMGMLYWADMSWLPLVAETWQFMKTGEANLATPVASAEPSPVASAAASPSPAAGGTVGPYVSSYPPDADTLQVKLRSGVMWSDDSPVSTQDVIDTFDILRLQSNTAWDYLDRVEAVDDTTLNFYMKVPSTVVERYVVRRSIMPSKIYGEYAQKLRDLVSAGKTDTDDDWVKAVEDFNNYRPKPEDLIYDGPYTFDAASITNAQMDLPKNPKSFWADQTPFDKLVNFNGETDTISAVVLSKDIDYATHGFAPATEQSMLQNGIRVLRPPTYSGAALKFNFKALKHFNDKRVRQALAYAIDRDQAGTVSLADSGVGVKLMAGLSDNIVPDWVSDEAQGMLNHYEFDPDKATALLQEAGWTNDGGKWKDPDGNEAKYDLSFPAEFADYSATGQNVVEQLNSFGFNVTARPVTYTQIGTDVTDSKFQMVIQAWGSSANPHPLYSYIGDFFTQNTRTDNPEGRGMDFPLKQTTESMGDVDLDAMVIATGEGMNVAEQKAAVSDIAVVFNELLNIIPLYERYGNNAALEGVRVKAWPADDDPILKNSPYADGIPTMLMLTSGLEAV